MLREEDWERLQGGILRLQNTCHVSTWKQANTLLAPFVLIKQQFVFIFSLSKTGGDEAESSSSSRTRYETWRRYSEFEMLRNFMQFVYPHVSEQNK